MGPGIPDNSQVAMGLHDLFKGGIALQSQYPVGLLDIAHVPQILQTTDSWQLTHCTGVESREKERLSVVRRLLLCSHKPHGTILAELHET